MNSIEEVKKRLEDDEDGMETDEIDDPSNPFRKQGETQTKGKRKVVSLERQKNVIQQYVRYFFQEPLLFLLYKQVYLKNLFCVSAIRVF